MDDGILASLRSYNILCELSRLELVEYSKLEAKIEASQQALAKTRPDLFVDMDWTSHVAQAAKVHPLAARLHALVDERRRMLSSTSGRLAVLRGLFDAGLLVSRKSIIFNETINQAEQVARLAINSGASVSIDHSRLSLRERTRSMEQFRFGASDCLVVVRTADVPDADQAVIVSGTMNARQRIQRLGRIVRLGGKPPRAITLLSSGTVEERVIAGRDLELLGAPRVETMSARSESWRDYDWRAASQA
jgi:superfamily II DNA or RNA helicase